MNEKGIDQAPIVSDEHFIGSISDTKILRKLIDDPTIKDQPVSKIMDPSFRFVASDNTIDVLSSFINKENKALLVREGDKVHIITQSDLLLSLTQ
ncbi:MAG: CBS domain-containing protein [Cyclobacteriaceae bacterium]|nr:CBS domain-containing protein [Cyclobacteriaceae bacterium]